MKNYYYLILLFCLCGCSVKDKIVEQQGQSLIMQAMVNGQWKVTVFTKGGTDVTADFSAYKFQFKSNYTVDAINGSAVERTGNWSAQGDLQAQSITSNFAGSPDPVALLNGTWNISSTTWTSVDANQTVSGESRVLRLTKL